MMGKQKDLSEESQTGLFVCAAVCGSRSAVCDPFAGIRGYTPRGRLPSSRSRASLFRIPPP